MDKETLRNKLFKKYFEVEDGVLVSDLIDKLSFIPEVWKKLHVLCENIKYVLEKDYNKRIKRNSDVVCINIQSECKKKDKKISDKECKVIRHSLKEYIDLDNMKQTRILSINEIIYCVSLLQKLGINDEEIRKFLKQTDNDNKNKNPIEFYNEIQEKLEFYSDNKQIQQSIKLIEDYFKELKEDEDSQDWKDLINEEIKKVYGIIPKNYVYEFTMASEMNKR